jgi:hypothetical protein
MTIYAASRDVMRARNADWHATYTLPTLMEFFQPSRDAHGSYWFDWTTTDEVEWKNNYRIWMQFLNDYKNRGGHVTTGSDSGFIFKLYGFDYIREMELLQEAGFHPLRIRAPLTAPILAEWPPIDTAWSGPACSPRPAVGPEPPGFGVRRHWRHPLNDRSQPSASSRKHHQDCIVDAQVAAAAAMVARAAARAAAARLVIGRHRPMAASGVRHHLPSTSRVDNAFAQAGNAQRFDFKVVRRHRVRGGRGSPPPLMSVKARGLESVDALIRPPVVQEHGPGEVRAAGHRPPSSPQAPGPAAAIVVLRTRASRSGVHPG